ncbi:MAG: ATPase domain-containing protein [Desulfurococcaceae archaeon]
MVELINTRVPGLDAALGGGVPRPGMTLITGYPGTGKTTLSAQILANRAVQDGEKGAYFSAVEPSKLLMAQLSLFDFAFTKAVDEGLISIKEAVTTTDDESVEIIGEQLESLSSQECRNIVFDSISALLTFTSAKHARALLSLLSRYSSEHEVALIVIGELPLFSTSNMSLGFEEFVSDVVIKLDFVERGHRLTSRMSVIKNRFAENSRAIYEVAVTRRGFEVLGPIRSA